MKKVIKENKIYILILIITIGIFYALKIINNFEIFSSLDTFVQNAFKNIYNPKNEKFLSIMSDLLGIYTPILILVCMLVLINKKIYFKLQFYSYIFTLIITTFTKNIIQRIRPSMNVLATIDIFSFPSAHTITSFVFYYLLAYLMSANSDKKTKVAYNLVATIIIFTIAMSRLYLDVHYITDILGAMIMGAIILKLIKNIIRKKYERKLV